MKIERIEVSVLELCMGFQDNGHEGVSAYAGLLDVRPAYQRELVYKPPEQKAVVRSVLAGFPLNVMYWAVKSDGTYEVLDGQQRTMSLCRYVNNDFAYDTGDGAMYYANLPDDVRARIDDYSLMVYVCDGTPSQKLDWFRTLNIAGKPHKKQELRNAVYSGPWLSDAKRHFSGGPAEGVASKYMKGSAIRQDYLETAIKWAKDDAESIEDYMAAHQSYRTATALWSHFRAVIDRVKAVFPTYRPAMKGVDWGGLYEHLRDESLDPASMEVDVARLMVDDEVQKKPGIYSYLLTGEERHLNLRAFSPGQRQAAYERQEGICAMCGDLFDVEDMEADHIDPWSAGGQTEPENCQVLCKPCNRRKSNK